MKKISWVLLIFSLILLITGCSWEVPEKISVKTKASYNFSFGNYNRSFEEEINMDSIMDKVDYPNAVVYDYYPGEKDSSVQEYLLKFPIMEIPVDFGRYFSETDIAHSIKAISFSRDISIPVINFQFDVKMDMSPVSAGISELFSLKGPASDLALGTLISAAQTATGKSFSSVIYKTGYFIVSCEGMDGNTVTLTNGSQSRTATFYSGVARINIDNFEFFPNAMRIRFSRQNPSKTFTTTISSSSVVKSVNGFTGVIKTRISEKADGITGLDTVESCIIGEGSLGINFSIPSNWNGVTANYGLQFHGGIETQKADFSAASNPSQMNLADAEISQKKITVDTDLSLSMTNAKIDFGSQPSISVKSDIKTIKSVVVKLSEKSISINQNQPLSDEMYDTVKAIILADCGIRGVYTNTLPEGNDVNLSVSSDFYAIHDKSTVIKSGDVEKEFDLRGDATERVVKPKKNPSAPNEFNKYDFNINLALPGNDPSKITVKNVTPGETYKLALSIEPVVNWKSISLCSPPPRIEPDTIGLGFDPTEILSTVQDSFGEGLLENIRYPSIMMYLYYIVPDNPTFANVRFTDSSLRLYKWDGKPSSAVQAEKRVVDRDTALEPTVYPDLAEKEGYVTTIIGNEPCSASVDISEVFNTVTSGSNSELYIDYTMNLTGLTDVTIYKDDLLSDRNASIAMYALIHIPLKFIAGDEINIDLQEMMNKAGAGTKKTDILGRSSATSLDKDIEKYMDAFRSVSIIYNPAALPFCADDMRLCVDLLGNGNYERYKFQRNVEGVVTVDYSKLRDVLNTYPVSPNIKIFMPKDSSLSIPRDIKLDINLSLNIQTDGTIDLEGGLL